MKNEVDNAEGDEAQKTTPSETKTTPETSEVSEPASNHNHAGYWIAVVVAVLLIFFLLFGSLFAFRFFNRRFVLAPRNFAEVNRVYRGAGFAGHFGREFVNKGDRISGKVTAATGANFAVDVLGTNKSVAITSTTRFPLNSATKVNVGDQVIVWGLQDSSGVIQATKISVNPNY